MKRALALIIIQTVLRLLRWIPLPVLHRMGEAIGWLMTLKPSHKNRIIQRNLALTFPELDVQTRILWWRQSAKEMACFALETGLVWHGSGAQVEKAVIEVSGWDHVDDAMASGRGLLLVGAHLGNWELLNLYFMRRLDMAALYKAPRDAKVNQWIQQTRERFGGRLIPSGSQAMRGFLKTLKSGGAAGLIADQQPRLGEGVMAPFFSEPALTMTLVGRLAQKTGCHVLMASCYRCSQRGFRIEVVPVLDDIRHRDTIVAATALNASIESAIKKAPQQYLWRYQRYAPEYYQP